MMDGSIICWFKWTNTQPIFNAYGSVTLHNWTNNNRYSKVLIPDQFVEIHRNPYT